ncbi:E3 ubiquitin-protein ligase HERC2-like isoform X2 [Macrobrachium nipponense]|uniref:E3 ubiquitin-protein ligase HERC2-like isoform X2 n=1 Tax=Macrobrachium nipponense TaxID=159736 RepID=UPI0030C83A2A
MICGCGNNISQQLFINGPQVLCCPTKVTEVTKANEVQIAFSYILWRTEFWRLTGYKARNSPPYDAIHPDWKVAVSENRIAAITERGSVVLWDKENRWRMLTFQTLLQSNSQGQDLEKRDDSFQLPKDCEGETVESHIQTVHDKVKMESVNKNHCECKSVQGHSLKHIPSDFMLISDIPSSSSTSGEKNSQETEQPQKSFQKLLIEDNALLAIDIDGVAYSSNIPMQVGRQQVSEIALGKEHCMALTKDGEVYTWGGGMRGQLGTGVLHFSDVPLQVENLHGLFIKSISCGGWHSTALSDSGDVYVWGWNESGQLGYPFKTKEKRSLYISLDHHCQCPEPVCQEVTSCSVDGTLSKATGVEIGVEKDKRINPERSKDVLNVQASPKLLNFWVESYSLTDIACGDQHTLFLLDDGSVWSVGMNKYGQLGLGHTECFEEPAEVPLKNVTKIFAGGWNSIFVTS